MIQMNRSIITRRRLLMLKWLIIFTPPVTVMMGHSVLGYSAGYSLLDVTVSRLAENLLVALLLLVLSYIFVETLFRMMRKLQAEASAQEQDLQTMNAVMQERERLSRELYDSVAQLVADLLLPCNVIVHEEESGSVVSIQDPIAMMSVANSSGLDPIAHETRERLQRVVAALNA